MGFISHHITLPINDSLGVDTQTDMVRTKAIFKTLFTAKTTKQHAHVHID